MNTANISPNCRLLAEYAVLAQHPEPYDDSALDILHPLTPVAERPRLLTFKRDGKTAPSFRNKPARDWSPAEAREAMACLDDADVVAESLMSRFHREGDPVAADVATDASRAIVMLAEIFKKGTYHG